MPLEITFSISDRDLERFRTIVGSARASQNIKQSREEIERATSRIVDIAMTSEVPDFIAERLLHMKSLLDMINDEEWNLGEKGRDRILTALSYFSDPVDLIPDHIPGVGFLDDAIFAEIVFLELQTELVAYQEFCTYREEAEGRLKAKGVTQDPDRALWIGTKRDELHARIDAANKQAREDDFLFHLL